MAMDRYTKLEIQIRTSYRHFMLEKLSTGRSRAKVIPAFDIPRSETVDLFMGPKEGTTLALVQRFDYVTVYRHTVGQLVGTLAHYLGMTDREIRKSIRGSKDHPAMEELKQAKVEPLKVSKRLAADRKAGKISIALVTEIPEVAQQAKELQANFFPVLALLKAWFATPIKRKKLCAGVEFYAADISADPPMILPMDKALKPLLK